MEQLDHRDYLLTQPFLLDAFGYEGGSYAEKYVHYRVCAPNDGVDIDVSEYAMYLLCTCFAFMKATPETRILAQDKRYNPSLKKFELRLHPSDTFTLRGDTAVNAFELMKQIVWVGTGVSETNQTIAEDEAGFVRKLRAVCEKEGLTDLLETHVRLCYGIGNFYPLPFRNDCSLNCAKGNKMASGYTRWGMRDLMQDYLKQVQSFFLDEASDGKVFFLLKTYYSDWMQQFGSGRDGWRTYVEQNYFQDFVDENDNPRLFWEYQPESPVQVIRSYLETINAALAERQKRLLEALAGNGGTL